MRVVLKKLTHIQDDAITARYLSRYSLGYIYVVFGCKHVQSGRPFEKRRNGEKNMEFTVCGKIYFSKIVNVKSFDAAREKVECMDYEELMEGTDGCEVTSVISEKTGNTVCY